jgi:two-component system, sensor histidine kinase and response regulator
LAGKNITFVVKCALKLAPLFFCPIRALQREGGTNLLDRVIRHYCEDSPRILERLRRGVGTDDAAEIRSTAHSFKSSSAYLGALQLSDLCRQMEKAGLDQRLEATTELLARIETEYLAASQALAGKLTGA